MLLWLSHSFENYKCMHVCVNVCVCLCSFSLCDFAHFFHGSIFMTAIIIQRQQVNCHMQHYVTAGGNGSIGKFFALEFIVGSFFDGAFAVWVRSSVLWPKITEQKCHKIYSKVKFVEHNFHFPILSRNFYGRYLNSKYPIIF
jgi:hypothetical protein